jgi:TPR repeat protein
MKFNRIGIAKRLILAKKFREAKKLLTPLARKNSAMAQLLLGYLYYGGDLNNTSKQ